MPATWKTVRVFISSTFRDMHAERDWLVKRVFPALRERLEKYRIHLVDIDLRWGVTEGEAEKDQVLDLCLSQIDECRPFFVGILGERYGWVPQTFTDEAASKYGWVQYQTGKSVTELEILYGVLRDPQMHGHGMFFFRDPAFIDDVPEAKQADLRAEGGESAEKLAALKQAIRDTDLPFPPLDGYPCQYAGVRINWQLASRELAAQADREAVRQVAENGIVAPDEYAGLDERLRPLVHRFGVVHLTGLEEFGRRVSQQLWQAIKAEHNLPDTPPTATGAQTDPLADEAGYHEAFMESRLRVYVGREGLQDQLMAYAEGEATHPCLVTGPSGSGKSAAVARFVRSYAEVHGEMAVIPHFVGASPGSTSLPQLLRRFCLELQRRFGPADEVPHDLNALVSRFRQALDGVPADARVVLVFDALNQLDETHNAHSMYWLPWQLPAHVKVVLSCIDDAPESSRHTPCADKQSSGDIPSAETGSTSGADGTRRVPATLGEPVLQAMAPRPVERVKIPLLSGDERLEIVSRVPSLSAKKLDPKQIGLLLANPATKNPLFLLVALEELRGFGSYEQVADRIAAFPHEGDDPVGAMFGQVIERLREEFDPEVVRTVLALLGVSRSGLSQRELLELIEGMGVDHSTSDLFPVLRQLRPYLQHRGELLDFFHRGLAKAVRARYLPEPADAVPYHGDLADYFHGKLNPPGAEAYSGGYLRGLTELPHHQAQGELWAALEATLTALPFLEAKTAAGWVFELAGDFSAAVEALPEHRPQRRILKLLDEALRRDIHFIARHANDYPQALFQCLWNLCWWYDCDEAAAYYENGRAPGLPSPSPSPAPAAEARGEGSPTQVSPPNDPRLCDLVEQWREQKERATPGLLWLRSRRPPPIHLGTAQLAVLRGHKDSVSGVAFSPKGDRIVSGSWDTTVRVWDAQSSAELAVLRGHESWLNSVAFSPQGDRIVGVGRFNDDTVRVWDAQSGAELAVLRGHEKRVGSVAFSPQGDRIASGSDDCTVRVWDAQSGAELAVFRGHKGEVKSVAFSPQGDRIASGSYDKTVRVWDAQSGAVLAVLRAELRADEWRVESVAFSPQGDRIASGSWDHTVRVWDAQSGVELAVLRGHESVVESVAFSPQGDRVASGSSDGTVRVWDGQSGAELAVLRADEWAVKSVAFSPQGDRIASGSRDGTVRMWDGQSGAELAVLRGHEGDVESVAFSPQGPQGGRIASGSLDGTVRVWDAQSGDELAVLRARSNTDAQSGAKLGGIFSEECVDSVAFSPQGDRIAAGSHDGTVWVWDAQSGAKLAVLRGHKGMVYSVAFSPQGDRIASGSWDHTVRVWDAQSGAELAVLRGHESVVESVAFSPQGDRIASGAKDETVRVWDAQSGAELAVLRGHEGLVESVVFSPQGDRIASGGSGLSKTVRVWDAQSGAELAVFRGHEEGVESVAFSPQGDRIASGSRDKTVRVWDAQSGAELAVLRGHESGVTSVAFSPQGDRIASGSPDGTVRVWDAQSGADLAGLRGHQSTVNSVAFSPQGDRIASVGGYNDKTVRVWDAQSGAELAVLHGHEEGVESVVFSPQGDRIASGGGFNDKTVRVWDVQSGAELAVLRGHQSTVNSVAFSPQGDRIASGSRDETVRVWDAQSGAELAVLRGHDGEVRSVAFSAQADRIASGSYDHTVRVWDAQSGAELAVLRGHEGWVESVVFSPQGDRIASVGGYNDKTVRVWDVQSGAELAVLRGHKAQVTSVVFSPQGDRIASGSSDWTVRVWDAQSGAEMEVLRGTGDVRAIAAGPPEFPYRALGRTETVIEQSGDGQTVAWFPAGLRKIVTCPSGRTWAAGEVSHLQIITLEGGDTLPSGERDLSVSHTKLGDVLRAQGDLTAALAAYRASLEIRARLAAADPGNASWQSDLSVSHNKLGDVLRAQGDLTAALAAYRASLAIRERLAAAEPGNASWQRDLSVSHNKLADVLRAQGDSSAALSSYRAAHEILSRLAAADPSNASWQRNLANSYHRLAFVCREQHDQAGFIDNVRKCFTVLDGMRQRGLHFDPQTAQVYQQRHSYPFLTDPGVAISKRVGRAPRLPGNKQGGMRFEPAAYTPCEGSLPDWIPAFPEQVRRAPDTPPASAAGTPYDEFVPDHVPALPEPVGGAPCSPVASPAGAKEVAKAWPEGRLPDVEHQTAEAPASIHTSDQPRSAPLNSRETMVALTLLAIVGGLVLYFFLLFR